MGEITQAEAEDEANSLLRSFEGKYGRIQGAVPVDEIAELHLGLHMESVNFEERYGIPYDTVFGCLDLATDTIMINERLLPENNGGLPGKYPFTVGHEIAHDRLHRPQIEAFMEINAFEGGNQPSHICRREDASKPLERQADNFAACLIMPVPIVLSAWKSEYGDYLPRSLRSFGEHFRPHVRERYSPKDMAEMRLKHVALPLGVSAQSLRIRYQNLGLLI